jgi:hypothetical protein
VFRRLLPRLGYQSAIWAVAHRLCRMVRKILHEGVRFIEQGVEPDPKAKKKRAQMLARALRKLGYEVTITPINLAIAENGMQLQQRIFEGVLSPCFRGGYPTRSQLWRDLENRSFILSATVVGRTVQLSSRVENYARRRGSPHPPACFAANENCDSDCEFAQIMRRRHVQMAAIARLRTAMLTMRQLPNPQCVTSARASTSAVADDTDS